MEGREEIVMRVKGGEFRFVQSSPMDFMAAQINSAVHAHVQAEVKKAIEPYIQAADDLTVQLLLVEKALERLL